MNELIRTKKLYGTDSVEKLKKSHVAVFGIGGVGGHVTEALARSGVGEIDIIDNDTVSESNINRQIIALHSTVGLYKVDVMEKRINDINPQCKVNKFKTFFLPENADEFDFSQYDYVVDSIDTVSGKLKIVMKAQDEGAMVISAMGAGNKLNPTMFEVSDIYKTSVCPLAKVMRKLCRDNGIKKLKVVYSKEEAAVPHEVDGEEEVSSKRAVPGSNAIVPGVAGLIIASEVIKDIVGMEK